MFGDAVPKNAEKLDRAEENATGSDSRFKADLDLKRGRADDVLPGCRDLVWLGNVAENGGLDAAFMR